MDDLQRTIATIGLQAAESFGFVLAGGYAIRQYGIGSRASDDVDIFTNLTDPDRFAEAVAKVCRAYVDAGLTAVVTRQAPTFARIAVSDSGGATSEIDLGVDYRAQAPAAMDIGPVLSLADAAGSKIAALYGRFLPRDYLDAYALLQSGKFSRDSLLSLADAREATPLDRTMLADCLHGVEDIDDRDFSAYGTPEEDIAAMRVAFHEWADDLSAVSPTRRTQAHRAPTTQVPPMSTSPQPPPASGPTERYSGPSR
ncbi:hypothetical protein ABIB25_000982 [Nakamurella sp. UYEF19]|uniref:nucleotidyl transferase AbiEii/AbiGii toxin family protein n=1 Tax=Nakamurella sp. UYEF19 TaxID=1756392 RepID=UPI00339AFD8A